MSGAARMVTIEVRDDEATRILTDGRCEACGHLEGLHNHHCCSFCTIEGCQCEWGEMPAPRRDDA
jgi:hypothetical protein